MTHTTQTRRLWTLLVHLPVLWNAILQQYRRIQGHQDGERGIAVKGIHTHKVRAVVDKEVVGCARVFIGWGDRDAA